MAMRLPMGSAEHISANQLEMARAPKLVSKWKLDQSFQSCHFLFIICVKSPTCHEYSYLQTFQRQRHATYHIAMFARSLGRNCIQHHDLYPHRRPHARPKRLHNFRLRSVAP